MTDPDPIRLTEDEVDYYSICDDHRDLFKRNAVEALIATRVAAARADERRKVTEEIAADIARLKGMQTQWHREHGTERVDAASLLEIAYDNARGIARINAEEGPS